MCLCKTSPTPSTTAEPSTFGVPVATLDAGSVAHSQLEEGDLPGQTLSDREHQETCPARSEHGCVSGEEPVGFCHHAAVLSLSVCHGESPRGQLEPREPGRYSSCLCTSGASPPR